MSTAGGASGGSQAAGATAGVAASAAGGDGEVSGEGGVAAGRGGGPGAGGSQPEDGGAAGSAPHKGWSVPTLIEDFNGGNTAAPRVAVNAMGVAVATWSEQEQDQVTYNLRSNRYDPLSKRWGSPQSLIVLGTPAGSWIPSSVAVDVTGNVAAVWQQQTGAIRANCYDATSSSWGVDQPIAAEGTYDASAPGVAMDAAGNAVAVWRAFGDLRYNIYASRYDAQSKAWDAARLLETASAGFASFPSVAVNAAGNAVAVWDQYDGSHENIYANRYDAQSKTWSGAGLIENDSTGEAYTPLVGVDAPGNSLAVWTLSIASVRTIFANRYDAGSASWGTPVQLDASSADGVGLAVNASGAAVAIGWSRTATGSRLWANRYAGPANGWSTSQIVRDSPAATLLAPAVAIDASGNAVAVWAQTEGQMTTLWASWYDTQSGSWGDASPIGNNTRYSVSIPQVAIDGSGNAVAVWTQSDGKLDSVWSSRFE